MEVSTRIQMRDNFDRFIALANEAGEEAARELVETAADDASDRAPVGPARRDYGRRPKLSANVIPVMVGPKTGHVVATPEHGGPQEKGAGPHPIPNAWGSGRTVMHPGNAAQPYIRPAIRALKAKSAAILRRYYSRLG